MNPATHYPLRVRKTKEIYLAFFIFCSLSVHCQSALNILDLHHEMFPEKKSLTITTLALVDEYNYFMNIAGVSFQEIASPAKNLKNEKILLDFVNNRLAIKIGKKTFFSDLPFWQLAPIVNFANSPYNVALTQISKTNNNRNPQCRFHPAFLDNLLGLRLFQADLLNRIEIMWDIPIDEQRHYILAPSERAYTPKRDSILQNSIYTKLLSGKFTSFVLTDKDVKFEFDVDEYGVIFTGKPYYCFTRINSDTSNFQSLRTQVFDCYNEIETQAKLLLKDEYSSALSPRTNLSGLLKVLNKYRQKSFNTSSMYRIEKALNRLDSLNNLTDAEIGIQFQILYEYTESFQPYWDLLKKYNPLVYSAVENTARWSAFFRYIRKKNPANWEEFVKKVENNGKWDAPTVKTPTSSKIK